MELLDQIGHSIHLNQTPKRIVSLVPSQTELLYDLGLGDRVVGITKFCIHPKAWFISKAKVGGTKDFSLEKIKALNPDLIIANKEENEQLKIEALQKLFPTYTSDIYTLSDAYQMMRDIGKLTEKQAEAEHIVKEIQEGFQALKPVQSKPSVLYFIWKNPYMLAGTETFIHHVLETIGMQNAITQSRYPVLTLEEIIAINPAHIFLSSEPYPFQQKHIEELQKHLSKTKISIVDGEMFSWYGSRLKHAPRYFKEIIQDI
jgi:ABC-type Fe3+-hydroxamate transport system substrate-binding protein